MFGPILHVVRYRREHLDKVCAAIGASGYGLTLGVHSRIADTADFIAERVNVGNLYVNRNQIGAVVGVQPFGGEGLSGTGPKAGGPHYLPRFAIERVRTTDITASGGNTQLLSLDAAAAATEASRQPAVRQPPLPQLQRRAGHPRWRRWHRRRERRNSPAVPKRHRGGS